jgi:hypothetical protein
MVTHIRYSRQQYRTPAECLTAIERFLSLGWWLSSIEGPSRGHYLVVFGVDDEDGAAS